MKNYEIKVLVPEELIEDIENIDLNIYFKEKANCRKKKHTFTDKEGIHYITGFKQEGSSRCSESEKNEE